MRCPIKRTSIFSHLAVMVPAVFCVAAFAGPGDQCKSAADSSKATCDGQVNAFKSQDAAAPSAATHSDIKNNASQTCAPTTNNLGNSANNAGQACSQAYNSCQSACNQAQQQIGPYCADPHHTDCGAQTQKLQQGTEECQTVMASANDLGNAAGANYAGEDGCNKTNGQSSGMPQMPSPQSGGNDSPTPSPTPTPTPTSACTGSDCSTTTAATDSMTGAGFVSPTTTPNSSTGSLATPSITPGLSPVSAPAASGASSMSPMSGSLGGDMKTQSTADKKATDKGQASVEGHSNGTAPPDGAGGGMSPSSASSDLGEYLPGKSKDPTRKLAAAAAEALKNDHPDISGIHSNLFDQVSAHFKLKCEMKELIGCK